MSKLAIIDADFLPFICSKEDLKESIANIDSMISTILQNTGATRYILCMSSPPYFRNKYNPLYKNKRKVKKSSLKWLNTLKGYMVDTYSPLKIQGLEADDLCLLIESFEPDSLVCSRDKDILKQCVNPYNFFTHTILDKNSKEDIHKFLWYQVLRGDSVDDIKGLIPGMGEVKCNQFIEDNKDNLRNSILNLAIEKYGVEQGCNRIYNQFKQVKILSSQADLVAEFGPDFQFNYSENILESTKGEHGNDKQSSDNFPF